MSFMNLPIANQLIDIGGVIVLLVVIFGIAYKLNGGSLHHFFHWQIFSKRRKEKINDSESSTVVPSFFTILVREVFAFQNLGTCSKTKRFSHFAIFWGFVFLAISTTLAFLTNPTNIVLPLYNPVKIFGNAGGALVVAGFVGMFYIRYREEAPIWRLTRSDLFLMTLFLAVVTGFVTQQTIYSSMGSDWVSSTFWIHMVFVIMLLATAPFTKFFHAISKPVSLLYQEMERRIGAEPLLPASTTASTSVKDASELKK
jgi:nitrate reductase gamma subunit